MPKIPRDISGRKLVALLKKHGYEIQRQTGSHIRLRAEIQGQEHKITIPAHDPIKIGTLNKILGDTANHMKISKRELIKKLFGE